MSRHRRTLRGPTRGFALHRGLGVLSCCAAIGCVDRAGTARGPVEFAGPPGSGESNLAVAADGSVLLTWLEPIAGECFALRFAVRDARVWTPPRTIRESNSFFVNWADFPSIVELPDGVWAVHWLQKVPGSVYAYHVNLAFSHDRGATWSEPIVPHRDDTSSEHGFVSMVPWPGGGIGLVWLDGRAMTMSDGAHEAAGDMGVRFTSVTPDATRGDEVLLDDRTCECCQTALARAGDAYVAAYRDRSAQEIRDIAVVRYANGVWGEPARIAEDGWRYPGCPVNGPALSAAGEAVAIAWYTEGSGRPAVHVAFSEDGARSFGAPIRMDDGEPLGRVDLELLPDGSAVVLWLEAPAGRGLVRARRVAPDGRAGRARTIAEVSGARASGFPRLARLGADSLLFAWTETGEAGGIRVAAGRVPW
ncbi:MAG: sialidase family protein [Gemmatimonadota bacterium]